jgi:GMP synthase (glutamine-hydrolysing)
MDSGGPFSGLDQISGIVSFGGMMSELGRARESCVAAELTFLKRSLEREVAVLGLCLGAQLLALAGGGDVVRLPIRHVRW